MKRTRIIALVSTLCMCLALFATGVWAIASTVLFSLNGNLKYYPEGVYVELSGQVYRGSSESTLEPITTDPRFTLEKQTNFDNSTGEPSGDFPIASWDIGSLPFAPQLRYIKIEVTIKNYSDFEILGTPTITGIDESDTNITVTNPGYVYAYIGEAGTYELILQLKDNANEISSKDITISFDIEKAVANYDYFTIDTNNQITRLNTDNYTSETAPRTLIIPAYSESGELLTIASGSSSIPTFNGLVSQTVILQGGLTSIGFNAFNSCSSLTSIEIPSSVISIGTNAFMSCSNLNSITLLEGLISVGNHAFANCSNLISITLPESVSSIDSTAFADCASLQIIVKEGNKNYSSNNGSLYNKDQTEIIRGSGGVSTVNILNSVTNISNSAFYGCKILTNITIPDGVTSIGNSAFSNCISMSNITFGENSQLTTISDYAFSNCSSLSSITLPKGLTKIGYRSFGACSNLTKVDMSDVTLGTLSLSWETFRTDALTSSPTVIKVASGQIDTAKTKLTSTYIGSGSSMTNKIKLTDGSTTYTWNGSAWI